RTNVWFGGLAVPYRQDEVATDKHVQLAEVDLLGVVQVARGPQDDKQGVAVSFQLRPLMRDDRVLDSEFMQRELPRQKQQLLLGWPVETDPRHTARLVPEHPIGAGQRSQSMQ